MAYTGTLPQSSAHQGHCLPATMQYNPATSDPAHLTMMAHSLTAGPMAGIQPVDPRLQGSVYGTIPTYHMASMSRDYQAASLQPAPEHGHGHGRYYTHHSMAAHPYGAIRPGFHVTALRQKAATKETTGPLKAWLRDHRANPYPTKGDKIMLAMVTRMTLTQVSTWFANARRRMKTDKPGTVNDSLSDTEDDARSDSNGRTSDRVPSCHGEHPVSTATDTNTPSSDNVIPPSTRTRKCVQRLFSPDIRTDIAIDTSSSPECAYGADIVPSPVAHCDVTHTRAFRHQSPPLSPVLTHVGNTDTLNDSKHRAGSKKSKIWSITDIIGSESTTPHYKTDDVSKSHDTDSCEIDVLVI